MSRFCDSHQAELFFYSKAQIIIILNCISFRWFALKAPIEEFYYFLFYLQRLLCESLHYLELLRMDRIFVFIPAVSGLDG